MSKGGTITPEPDDPGVPRRVTLIERMLLLEAYRDEFTAACILQGMNPAEAEDCRQQFETDTLNDVETP